MFISHVFFILCVMFCYQPDSASSVGDIDIDRDSIATEDSSLTQDQELDFTPDPNDLIIEDNLTNKPLAELLRVSTRSSARYDVTPALPAAPTAHSAQEPPPSLMTADGTLITDQNPGFSLVERFHRLMADFIVSFTKGYMQNWLTSALGSAVFCVLILLY